MSLKEKELTVVAAVFMLLFLAVGYLYLTVPVSTTCNCGINDTETIQTIIISNEQGYLGIENASVEWIYDLVPYRSKHKLTLQISSWELLEYKTNITTKVIKTSEDKK